MSIVFITIPGEEKKKFANALHKKTDGGVALVLVQKRKAIPFLDRLKRLYGKVAIANLPKELWYGALLRLGRSRRTLEYFREHSIVEGQQYVPKMIEIDSVNGDEAYAILQKISPSLLVIWGSTIVSPRILKTAKTALNLHMGHCPHYKGALANQCAVLHDDFPHIGATIHYAEEKVDAGDILAVTAADLTKPPREMFRDLHDRAVALYIDTAVRIFNKETLPAKSHNGASEKNLLLKNWIPSVRYKLAKKMLNWEKTFRERDPAKFEDSSRGTAHL